MLSMVNLLSVVIPPEMQQKIDAIAKKEGTSRNAVLRKIINFYFAQQEERI